MACVSVCYMYRARIGFKKVKKVILFGQRCKARNRRICCSFGVLFQKRGFCGSTLHA